MKHDDTTGLTSEIIREVTDELEDLEGMQFKQAGEVNDAIDKIPVSALVDDADRERFKDAMRSIAERCRENTSDAAAEPTVDNE